MHLAGMMGVWRPMEDYRARQRDRHRERLPGGPGRGSSRRARELVDVYGMGLGKPALEDFPLLPMHEPYALTKAEGDASVQRMIAEDQLKAVIIRPVPSRTRSELNFGRIADRVRAGRWVMVGSGRNALPLVYVTDVVEGLLLALEQDGAVGQAYNISNDRPLSQREFLDAVAREIGAAPPRLRVPYRALYAIAYSAERLAELTRSSSEPVVTRHGVNLFGTDNRHAIDKARSELGYRPRMPLDEGIRNAAAWYEQVASAPRG